MELKLKKLKIKQFKGISNFETDFKTTKTHLIGANGTGKSSVLDAICWVIFGKTHDDRKKFDIMPLDELGNMIPDMTPDVTLTIERGGTVSVLRRTYKKGTASMSIDEIPYKATEFSNWVTDCISDDTTFKMLINPLYISESLSPKEQRALFLTYFDMPSKKEVFAKLKKDKKKDSKPFIEKLNTGITAGQILLWADAKRKETKSNIDINSGKIALITEQMGNFKSDMSKAELTAKRDRIQLEVNEYQKKLRAETQKDITISRSKAEVMRIKDDISRLTTGLKDLVGRKVVLLERELAGGESIVNSLTEDWKALTKTEFKTKCPTCNQNVPKIDLEQAKERIKSKMARIGDEGKQQKLENEKLQAQITKTKTLKALPEDKKELTRLRKLLKQAQETVKGCEPPILLPSIGNLTTELSGLNEALVGFDSHRQKQMAKADYLKIQGVLSAELETAEEIETACKVFENTKAQIVVDKVNKQFSGIQVKLFEKLKNGGYRDTFFITRKGVPYSELNTAGRLEAGMELTDFISKKKDLFFPMLLDNAERYTDIAFPKDKQIVICEAVKNSELKVKGVK